MVPNNAKNPINPWRIWGVPFFLETQHIDGEFGDTVSGQAHFIDFFLWTFLQNSCDQIVTSHISATWDKNNLKEFLLFIEINPGEEISQVMSLWIDQVWMFTSPKRWFFGGVAGCLFLHIKELMSTEKWQKCSRQGWNPSIFPTKNGCGFWCLDQSLGSPSQTVPLIMVKVKIWWSILIHAPS